MTGFSTSIGEQVSSDERPLASRTAFGFALLHLWPDLPTSRTRKRIAISGTGRAKAAYSAALSLLSTVLARER